MTTTNHQPGDDPRDDDHDGDHDGDVELACGRSLDAVIEQVADGHAADRDAHQGGCVHCQAALGEYERLWAPLRELAAENVTAPEAKIDEALAKIRGAIAEPDYATFASTDGVTRVAARVVVVAARHTAQAVPGVRVALSKNLTGHATDSEVTAGVAGSSAAIEITLAADYGQELHKLGDQVRHAVTTRVRQLTDIEPVEVTVIIDDVLG